MQSINADMAEHPDTVDIMIHIYIYTKTHIYIYIYVSCTYIHVITCICIFYSIIIEKDTSRTLSECVRAC